MEELVVIFLSAIMLSLPSDAATERLGMKSVTQETDYCLGIPQALGPDRPCWIDCPRRRVRPDQRLLSGGAFRMSSDCLLDTLEPSNMDTQGLNDIKDSNPKQLDNCPREPPKCFEDFLYRPGGGDYTFSVLYSSEEASRRKRLMAWDSMTLDIQPHTNGTTTVYLMTRGAELVFNAEQRTSLVHLMIIGSHPIGGQQSALRAHNAPRIVMNGKDASLVSVVTRKLEGPSRKNTIRIGYKGLKGPAFVDVIYMLDVFNRTLNTWEIEGEFKYVMLWNTSYVWFNNYYYECICPFGSHLTEANECSDGSNRFGFTRNQSHQYFYPPDAVNNDGTLIKENTNNTGLWMATKDLPLHIIIDRPAVLTSISIFAFPQLVTVSIMNDDGEASPLFCVLERGRICDDWMDLMKNQTVKWESMSHAHSKLVWRFGSAMGYVVAEKLLVEFNGSKSGVMHSASGENPIYRIEIDGRYLDSETSPGECVCFPGNGLPGMTSCNNCGQCRCRSDVITPAENKQCRPFLTDIVPSYGPVSGGTQVTLNGGLLLPGIRDLNKNASVTIGPIDRCIVNFSNDTLIICTTEVTNRTTMPEVQMTQYVHVGVPIDAVIYPIKPSLQFTYRPNPVITNVEPYKTILHGGLNVTMTGKHMDSVYAPVLTITVRTIKREQRTGDCWVNNSTTIVCRLPQINLPADKFFLYDRKRRETRQLENHVFDADLGLSLDGVVTYSNLTAALPQLGSFKIYQNPKFDEVDSQTFRPYRGDEILEISGQRLDYGCEKTDYFIWLGNEYCQQRCHIERLFSNLVTCRPPSVLDSSCGSAPVLLSVAVGELRNVIGRVKYELSYLEDTMFVAGVFGGLISVLFVIIMVVLGIWLWKRRRVSKRAKEKELEDRYLHLNRTDYQALIAQEPDDPDLFLDLLSPDLKHMVKSALINESELTIQQEIGQGNFGKVHRGTLFSGQKEKTVAVKTLRDETVNNRELGEFLEEATIMKDFHHPNVLSLLGVVIRKGRVYVVLPYMSKGDLKSYINKQSYDFIRFSTYGCDVARGMAYLAKQKFIHRDLAARNCMVDDTDRVLVADFGLARDIYEKDYYRLEDKSRPLPAKWMALESLQGHTFTTKSDVWSFGVLMWEIFTRGSKPFADVNNFYLREYLQSGFRLEKPQVCPDILWGVITRCWLVKPDDRPSFDDLVTDLEMIIENYSGRTRRIDIDYDDTPTNGAHKNVGSNKDRSVCSSEGSAGRNTENRAERDLGECSSYNPYTGTTKNARSRSKDVIESSDNVDCGYFTPVDPNSKVNTEIQSEQSEAREREDLFLKRELSVPNDYCEPVSVNNRTAEDANRSAGYGNGSNKAKIEGTTSNIMPTEEDYLTPVTQGMMTSGERHYVNTTSL